MGNPGIPDGHIEPDTIAGMDPDLYEDICQGTRDKERSKSVNEYEIGGREIHLFNITGIWKYYLWASVRQYKNFSRIYLLAFIIW